MNGIYFILLADISKYNEHNLNLKNLLLTLHESENRTVMNALIVSIYVVVLSSCITVVLDQVWTPFITVLLKTLLKGQTCLQE